MKFFKKNKIIKISVLVILVFIIVSTLGLSIVHLLYGNHFKYSEWLTLVVSTLISILGVLGSIITILIAINSINDSKKIIDLRKRKLAIILEYEINTFLVSFFNVFYNFLDNWNYYNFEDSKKPEFYKESLNMLSVDFKEMLYELIDIDGNKESLEIFEFFKVYENCIQKLNKFKDDQEQVYIINSFMEIFEFAFNEDYSKHAVLSSFRVHGIAYNYLPINEDEKEKLRKFYNNKINLYKKDNTNELLKEEFSEKIIDIFKYLDSLKMINI